MAELTRLPGPNADLWDWQLHATCKDVDRSGDLDPFFHPEAERGPRRRTRDARAVAICETCPVIRECRAHALAVKEPYGVWGGLTQDDRLAIYADASGDRATSAAEARA